MIPIEVRGTENREEPKERRGDGVGYLFVSSMFITVVLASAAVIIFYHGLVKKRSGVVSKRHSLILALEKRERAATPEEMNKSNKELEYLQKAYLQEIKEYNRYLGKWPHRIFAWVLGIELWEEGTNE